MLTSDKLGVISPKALQEVKDHFDCQELEAVPLENEGTSGSLGSHWERAAFGDESMSAQSAWESKYSRVTMGFMEDSGWYKFDYD